MAATEPKSPLTALLQAALALPVLAIPARAGAIESGEVGLNVLGYKERGLMKVVEPVAWGVARFGEGWEVRASGAVDLVTGASPELVTNIGGKPVQVITGASVDDRRTIWDRRLDNLGELLAEEKNAG